MKTRNVRRRQWWRYLMRLDSYDHKHHRMTTYRISENAWRKWLQDPVGEMAFKHYQRSSEETRKFEAELFGRMDQVAEQMTGVLNIPGIEVVWDDSPIQTVELPKD